MSIFNCLNPVYTMNENQKKTCPRTLGLIYATVVVIITLIGGVYIYFDNSKKTEDAVNDKEEKSSKLASIISSLICGIIIAISVYFGSQFFFNIRVTQNESMIQTYMDTGMTRANAIGKIARLRQNQELTAATRARSR